MQKFLALHDGDDPLTPMCLFERRHGSFAKSITDLASSMILVVLCFLRDGLLSPLLVSIVVSSICWLIMLSLT